MKNLLIILTIILISCGPNDEVKPAQIPDNKEDCPLACKKLNELSCNEGNDLVYPQTCMNTAECLDGKCINGNCVDTCQDFCEYMIENGSYLNVNCWKTIKSCEEIDTVCRPPV